MIMIGECYTLSRLKMAPRVVNLDEDGMGSPPEEGEDQGRHEMHRFVAFFTQCLNQGISLGLID